MPDILPWFPLSNVTARYVYPDKEVEYVANVWIDSTQNIVSSNELGGDTKADRKSGEPRNARERRAVHFLKQNLLAVAP